VVAETERLPPTAAASLPEAFERGQVLADRYVVDGRIGRGGGCLVYRAFDRGLRDWIAIKVLDPARFKQAAIPDALFRELRHARELQHPHLCRLYDVVGADADTPPFLTMALAEGGSLRDTLAREGDRPLAQRLTDVEGLLSGLAALHAAGIIHRDVKPENVLRLGDGRVVLSDFGLAVAPDRATHLTGGVGTPVYMAPELRLGAVADARSDVWSAGLVMQEVLFGVRSPREPVKGGTGGRRLRRLKRLCDWCLDSDPDRRPADAGVVLGAFRRDGGPWWSALPRKQLAWGAAVTLAALAVAAIVVRSRGATSASPTLTELHLEGQPRALAGRMRVVGQLDGRVHCQTLLPDGSLGLIWGEPRRAERLDRRTGARTPWEVPLRSYEFPATDIPDPPENRCPQIGPDGKRLLYWGAGAGNQRAVFLQDDVHAEPTLLTTGSMPVWHPGGDLLALRIDDQHPGLFNLKTRHLMVLPQPRENIVALSQLIFDAEGRQLLVRSADGAAGYSVTRYDMDRLPHMQTVIVRHGHQVPEHIVRLTLGASLASGQLVHPMMPSGRYGIASLDWHGQRIRWLAELPEFDVTGSLATGDSGLLLLARRWTSDLQVLRNGEVVRTVLAEGPASFSDANVAGDVAAQMDQGGRVMVMLFRQGESRPRVLGPGPLDAVPSFSPDGRLVLFGRGDIPNSRDYLIVCTLEGSCRSVGTIPNTSNDPKLSASGDQVAYVNFSPYPHVALLDLGTGASRMLAPALPCAPRWLGDNVWVAQGVSEDFSWVEVQAATGQATGRKVAGKSRCGAEGPGPEGVLEQRLRVVHRESSRLLALDDPL
jgi:hypothetical protein